MKIQVDIHQNELDAVEEFATNWILCAGHRKHICEVPDWELFKMQMACEDCMKLYIANKKLVLRMRSKLANAYEKAKKA